MLRRKSLSFVAFPEVVLYSSLVSAMTGFLLISIFSSALNALDKNSLFNHFRIVESFQVMSDEETLYCRQSSAYLLVTRIAFSVLSRTIHSILYFPFKK